MSCNEKNFEISFLFLDKTKFKEFISDVENWNKEYIAGVSIEMKSELLRNSPNSYLAEEKIKTIGFNDIAEFEEVADLLIIDLNKILIKNIIGEKLTNNEKYTFLFAFMHYKCSVYLKKYWPFMKFLYLYDEVYNFFGFNLILDLQKNNYSELFGNAFSENIYLYSIDEEDVEKIIDHCSNTFSSYEEITNTFILQEKNAIYGYIKGANDKNVITFLHID